MLLNNERNARVTPLKYIWKILLPPAASFHLKSFVYNILVVIILVKFLLPGTSWFVVKSTYLPLLKPSVVKWLFNVAFTLEKGA